MMGGALAYIYMEPLFSSVGMPLATVALYVLSIGAASVGMCLGVLLPLPFPGICFGASLTVFAAMFISFSSVSFMVTASVMALVFAVLSLR